jgi:hypothetical protein
MMADRGQSALRIANYNQTGRAMLGCRWCVGSDAFCSVDDDNLQ